MPSLEKKESEKEDVSLPTLSDIEKMGKYEESAGGTGIKEFFSEEKVEESKEEKAPQIKLGAVPAFIKFEKYEEILDKISEIRRNIEAIKSSIDALREIENMREDSIKNLQDALEDMEKKFLALDAEFVRPISHED